MTQYRITVALGDTSARIFDDNIAPSDLDESMTQRRVNLSPVAIGPDGTVLTGHAARVRADEEPAAAVTDLPRRLGDLVPCRLKGYTAAPDDLLVEALRAPLDEIRARRGAPPHDLLLVHPTHWGSHRRQRLAEAFARAGLAGAHPLPAAVAVLEDPMLSLPDGTDRALVIDAGSGRMIVSVLSRSAGASEPDGRSSPGDAIDWRVDDTVIADVGEEDVDDALLAFVLQRLPEAPVGEQRNALRAVCRTAREDLYSAPAAEIATSTLPLPEPLRIVRGDLDGLIGETLRTVLARTVSRLDALAENGTHAGADVPAVLIGSFARVPLLVEIASTLLERPILVPAEPADAAVEAAARRPAGKLGPERERPVTDAPEDAGAPEPDPGSDWSDMLRSSSSGAAIFPTGGRRDHGDELVPAPAPAARRLPGGHAVPPPGPQSVAAPTRRSALFLAMIAVLAVAAAAIASPPITDALAQLIGGDATSATSQDTRYGVDPGISPGDAATTTGEPHDAITNA